MSYLPWNGIISFAKIKIVDSFLQWRQRWGRQPREGGQRRERRRGRGCEGRLGGLRGLGVPLPAVGAGVAGDGHDGVALVRHLQPGADIITEEVEKQGYVSQQSGQDTISAGSCGSGQHGMHRLCNNNLQMIR